MKHFDVEAAHYTVCGITGYTLTEAMQHWKTKFETFQHFKRDVIKHPNLAELGRFVEERWDGIKPISVGQAMTEKNLEKRRIMFDCIGVAKLFKTLSPDLLDKQIIQKNRTRWDGNNEPYQSVYDDTYELYRIDGQKLFVDAERFWDPEPVYAVRCWCTTTQREYWIYIPQEIVTGESRSRVSHPDAIRAIAWTIRLDISFPKRIFRQGDIIVAEESADSKEVTPYHLTKDTYLSLMYSET